MRCDEMVGLNAAATEFLKDNETLWYTDLTIRYFPDGSTRALSAKPVFDIQKEICGQVGRMYPTQPDYNLEGYTLKNGMVVQEFVQRIVWSCGRPCVFLALRYKESQETVEGTAWSEAAIVCNS